MPKSLEEKLKQSKPFENLEVETFLNILRTHSLLADGANALFREFGITLVLYNLLRIVRGAGDEGIACSEISDRLVTRVPDVTRLVDRLVKSGLVTRHRPEHDRRVVLLNLTRKGARLLMRIEEPMLAYHRERMKHLNKAELKTLIALLTKLRAEG